jgi:hypothetical protein
VAFEPPAVRLLPDGARWIDFFHGVYDLYRESGCAAALQRFRAAVFAEPDRLAMARAMDAGADAGARANAEYWFEHELRQYPTADLDVPVLAERADRVVPAVGRLSAGYPACESTVELSRRLGLEVTELPGGHVGCVTHAAEFAAELVHALARHGDTLV